jgi:toxin ParE1/3/4
MFSIKITKSARKDLTEILKYTLTEHGELQWEKYGQMVEQNFDLLSKNPTIGYKRNDIPENCLTWPIGNHYIIYKIIDQSIFILRILHQKMNFVNSFNQ